MILRKTQIAGLALMVGAFLSSPTLYAQADSTARVATDSLKTASPSELEKPAAKKAMKSDTGFDLEKSLATIACYRHLDELLKNARIKNEIEEFRWKKLYENSEVQIVNEILPSNAINDPVDLNGYLDALTNFEQGGTMNTYQFEPYALKLISANPNEFVFQIDAKKEVGMLNFESIFFRDQFDLRYVLVYNRETAKVLIRSVKLNEEKGYFMRFDFPESLLSNSELGVLVNGEEVKRNLDKGIMLSDLKDGEKLTISPMSDELLGGFSQTLKKESFQGDARYDGDFVKLKFRPKRFYLDLNYQIDNGGVVDHTINMAGTDEAAVIQHKMRGSSIGLGLGYRLMNVKDKFFLSLELGAQQRSMIVASRSDYMLSSYADTDPQFGSVERYTRASYIEEGGDINVLSAGLGLNLRFKLHHLAHLEVGGAYNMGLSMSGSYNSTGKADYYFIWNQADVRIYGDNPEYGTYVDEQTAGSGDLNVDSYNNIALYSNFAFRISKQLWAEIGVNYGIHNWSFTEADEIILSRSYNSNDQGANQSLKHLTGTLSPLSTLGYQIGIKYYL